MLKNNFLLPPSLVPATKTQLQQQEAETGLPKVLSVDMMGQLHVFAHYGYMLGMYSTQVGILQNASYIVFCSFLEPQNDPYLKT